MQPQQLLCPTSKDQQKREVEWGYIGSWSDVRPNSSFCGERSTACPEQRRKKTQRVKSCYHFLQNRLLAQMHMVSFLYAAIQPSYATRRPCSNRFYEATRVVACLEMLKIWWNLLWTIWIISAFCIKSVSNCWHIPFTFTFPYWKNIWNFPGSFKV